MKLSALVLFLTTLVPVTPVLAQEQMGDPDFRPVVARPAYATGGPRILLDEAHGGVQTMAGRYAGFAALVRADGYRIASGTAKLDQPGALDGVDVLVISNPARNGDDPSAFTAAEIAAVEAWVRAGGSLLLAADHAPHGAAAEALGAAFGVGMGKGYAFQRTAEGLTTNLDFPRPALGDHPILSGRSADERIDLVHTFTGQSLSGPPGAVVLMAMSEDAREAADLPTRRRINDRIEAGEPAEVVIAELSAPARPAQGLAFTHGNGRVVVLGEAGMLTAQLVRFGGDQPDMRFGLQTEGHDDQQFALNVLHWLSGLLP